MYFRNVFLCVNTKTRPSPIQPAAVQTDTNVRQSERAEQELSARRRAQHNAILEIGKQKSLLNSQRMPLSISPRDKIKTTLTSDTTDCSNLSWISHDFRYLFAHKATYKLKANWNLPMSTCQKISRAENHSVKKEFQLESSFIYLQSRIWVQSHLEWLWRTCSRTSNGSILRISDSQVCWKFHLGYFSVIQNWITRPNGAR